MMHRPACMPRRIADDARLLSFSLLRRCCRPLASAQILSIPPDQADRSVSAGRDHRPVRPPGGGGAARQVQPAGDRREQARRPGRHRPARTAQGRAGRLYAMVGTVGSVVIGYAMDASPHFDPLRDLVPVAGTAEYATAMVVNNKTAGEFSEGVHRLCQGAARQAQLRLDRRRRLDYLAVELFMRRPAPAWCTCPTAAAPPRSTISWAARSTCSSRCFRSSWSRSGPA